MEKFSCSECGYIKAGLEEADIMLEMPMFGSYGSVNMIPMINSVEWVDNTVCMNCKKSASWGTGVEKENNW